MMAEVCLWIAVICWVVMLVIFVAALARMVVG